LELKTNTDIEWNHSILAHLSNVESSAYWLIRNSEILILIRAPTTLKSEGEVTSLSGADKREVRDNREKW
jgi:hypothetical protein